MKKEILIEKLNISFSNIEQLITRISEKDMNESIARGYRTPKDIIAHIAAWNWNGIEWIESIAKGEKPILPLEGHSLNERDEIFANLNDAIHEANREKTLKQVLDNHYESWRVLLNLAESLSQEDLDRIIDLDWAANPFPAWTIVAWRIQHADNHMSQIYEWMNRQ